MSNPAFVYLYMRNVRDCISVLVTVCSACFLLTSLPCAGATRLTVSTLCFQAFCMKSEAALCRAGGAHPATCIEREAFSIPHSSFPQIVPRITRDRCCWKEEMLCLKPWHPTTRPEEELCPAAKPARCTQQHPRALVLPAFPACWREHGCSVQCCLLPSVKWCFKLPSGSAANYLICQADSCTVVFKGRD